MQEYSTKFIQGLELFNKGEFYEAHEYFEAVWRETTEDSREFYRALIQLSGGFFRLTQERPAAARKFFARALSWLQDFPNPYLGFDTTALRANLHTLIEAIDQNTESDNILKQHFHPVHPLNPQWSA